MNFHIYSGCFFSRIGSDGINGQDAPYIENYADLDGHNFEELGLIHCGSAFGLINWNCKHIAIYGTKAIRPGHGGNGGASGIEGNAGKAFIATFHQPPDFSIVQKSG